MSNLNWTKHDLLFLIRPVFYHGCFYTFTAFGSRYSLLFPPSSLSCKHGLRPEKLAHSISHPGRLPCYGLALCQSTLLFSGLMIHCACYLPKIVIMWYWNSLFTDLCPSLAESSLIKELSKKYSLLFSIIALPLGHFKAYCNLLLIFFHLFISQSAPHNCGELSFLFYYQCFTHCLDHSTHSNIYWMSE